MPPRQTLQKCGDARDTGKAAHTDGGNTSQVRKPPFLRLTETRSDRPDRIHQVLHVALVRHARIRCIARAQQRTGVAMRRRSTGPSIDPETGHHPTARLRRLIVNPRGRPQTATRVGLPARRQGTARPFTILIVETLDCYTLEHYRPAAIERKGDGNDAH